MSKVFSRSLCLAFLLISLNTFAYAEDFVYNSHERRDPFVPPYLRAGAEEKPKDVNIVNEIDYSAIVLQAVVYDPAGASAVIINGRIMKISDQTDFFILKDITPDGAVVEVSGERKTLKLRKDKNDANGKEQKK